MEISRQQTLPFGDEESTCSRGGRNCISGKNGFASNTNSQRWKKCDIARKSERKNIAGIGSMDGITFPKWRAESIKSYGNAIVPQVAYRIFDTINKYESL